MTAEWTRNRHTHHPHALLLSTSLRHNCRTDNRHTHRPHALLHSMFLRHDYRTDNRDTHRPHALLLHQRVLGLELQGRLAVLEGDVGTYSPSSSFSHVWRASLAGRLGILGVSQHLSAVLVHQRFSLRLAVGALTLGGVAAVHAGHFHPVSYTHLTLPTMAVV